MVLFYIFDVGGILRILFRCRSLQLLRRKLDPLGLANINITIYTTELLGSLYQYAKLPGADLKCGSNVGYQHLQSFDCRNDLSAVR